MCASTVATRSFFTHHKWGLCRPRKVVELIDITSSHMYSKHSKDRTLQPSPLLDAIAKFLHLLIALLYAYISAPATVGTLEPMPLAIVLHHCCPFPVNTLLIVNCMSLLSCQTPPTRSSSVCHDMIMFTNTQHMKN